MFSGFLSKGNLGLTKQLSFWPHVASTVFFVLFFQKIKVKWYLSSDYWIREPEWLMVNPAGPIWYHYEASDDFHSRNQYLFRFFFFFGNNVQQNPQGNLGIFESTIWQLLVIFRGKWSRSAFDTIFELRVLKSFQKKQSFSLEKDCFFVGFR